MTHEKEIAELREIAQNKYFSDYDQGRMDVALKALDVVDAMQKEIEALKAKQSDLAKDLVTAWDQDYQRTLKNEKRCSDLDEISEGVSRLQTENAQLKEKLDDEQNTKTSGDKVKEAMDRLMIPISGVSQGFLKPDYFELQRLAMDLIYEIIEQNTSKSSAETWNSPFCDACGGSGGEMLLSHPAQWKPCSKCSKLPDREVISEKPEKSEEILPNGKLEEEKPKLWKPLCEVETPTSEQIIIKSNYGKIFLVEKGTDLTVIHCNTIHLNHIESFCTLTDFINHIEKRDQEFEEMKKEVSELQTMLKLFFDSQRITVRKEK